jgi:hypothetical protein
MSDAATRGAAAPHVLREYALLADGERGAVIGPRGDIVWLCFPRWDDDALLAALVGGAGSYAVTPEGRFVWGGYYEPGGLIWRSRWITEQGAVECREALALPGRPDRAVLLRRVLARRGPARLRVVLDLRAGFGREPARDVAQGEDGLWRGRAGPAAFCWVGGQQAEPRREGDGEALVLDLALEPGQVHDLTLVLDARGEPEPPDSGRLWDGTEQGWRERVPALELTAAPRDARHAYAVLSGLTSMGGGMVAAATTSLPERAGSGRSYDYRYVWIRDQCYTGQAVAADGPHALMDDAVRFVTERLLEHGPGLAPAYTTRGEAIPEQRRLDLPGYPGGTDIVGNHVVDQFQLDVFGESLLLLAAAGRHDHLDAEGWRAVLAAAEAIAQRWREPDAGIWELERREWTHSRLTCVAGLRAVAALPEAGGDTGGWLALADAILADCAARCMHPSGRWQRAVDDPRVDSALLVSALRGAVAPEDPRSVATLRAILDELSSDGYAYRFRPDERPLGEAEGAFLLCGFWMALAQGRQGDHVAAARWFERNRAACGPPGLLSEEFDVEQRQLRGNLPQAFVHALLLEAAVAQSSW